MQFLNCKSESNCYKLKELGSFFCTYLILVYVIFFLEQVPLVMEIGAGEARKGSKRCKYFLVRINYQLLKAIIALCVQRRLEVP